MKTEKKIMKLLKSWDEEAIRLIFDQYFEKFCLYAEGFIKDPQAAEDIVEEFFVSVWINSKTNLIHTTIKN